MLVECVALVDVIVLLTAAGGGGGGVAVVVVAVMSVLVATVNEDVED